MSLRWLFTTTDDGNLATHVGDDPTAVERNRHRLAVSLGVQRNQLRFMNQVHGNDVVFARHSEERTAEADGIVTNETGLALVVLVADCIPVLFHSKESVIAAVHVGRKGLVNGVAHQAVEKMLAAGATEVTAIFGPAICGECYEVPDTMQSEVCSVAPAAYSVARTGKSGLDIRAGLRAQLEDRGITVEVDSRCTQESPELFSYRRDQNSGRFAGIILAS